MTRGDPTGGASSAEGAASRLALRGHGDWESSPRTGREQTPLLSSRRTGMKTSKPCGCISPVWRRMESFARLTGRAHRRSWMRTSEGLFQDSLWRELFFYTRHHHYTNLQHVPLLLSSEALFSSNEQEVKQKCSGAGCKESHRFPPHAFPVVLLEQVTQRDCGVSILAGVQKPWASSSRWPCSSRGLGPHDLQRSLPTSATPRFCGSMCSWTGGRQVTLRRCSHADGKTIVDGRVSDLQGRFPVLCCAQGSHLFSFDVSGRHIPACAQTPWQLGSRLLGPFFWNCS